MNNITKSNIFDYITNLLLESEYYVRFESRKDEASFINYIWNLYEEFNKFINSKNIYEKTLYKEKYISYFDFDNYNEKNELMKMVLLIDTTEYSSRHKLSKCIFLNIDDSKIHWLLRIGNGNNFKNSSKFNIWGVKQTNNTKFFEKTVKKGDILWFVVSNNNGQAIAFAEFISYNERTKTDTELGWGLENNSNNWTTEINYKNLSNIENGNYFTNITGQNVNIRKYNDKCKINLPEIYKRLKM